MQGFIEPIERRLESIRATIEEYVGLQRFFFIYVLTVLVINMLLIIYAMLMLVIRMTLSGLPVLDSAPLALYILPLIVILISILRGYRATRIGLPSVIVLLLAGVVFGLISALVHGFIALSLLNIFAVIIIPLIGPMRSRGSIRNIGKKGIVWFIILNVLGALFPISVVTMGHNPITYVQASIPSQISIDIPLDTSHFPSNDTLDLIETSRVKVNLHLFDYKENSWTILEYWISNLTSRNIEFTITVTTDRFNIVTPHSLGSNEIFATMYTRFTTDVSKIRDIVEMYNPTNLVSVILDMRLSKVEWSALMAVIRNVNLPEFSVLIRNTIDHINRTQLEHSMGHILTSTTNSTLQIGALVDSLVVDDYLDGDGIIMLVGGITPKILAQMKIIEVDISRTKFSDYMAGDVGEYLAYSYATTLGKWTDHSWSLRLGQVSQSQNSTTYKTVTDIAREVALVGGCGVNRITIESIDGILLLGNDSLENILDLMGVDSPIPVTYTFRIYAFRAVTMAIDSFDTIIF